MRAPLLGPLAASSLFSLASAQAPEYGNPGSDSSLGSGDAASDGAANASPTCHQGIATTVFVTVFPTSPANPSDGSYPDGESPVQTITETIPATTVFVSAGAPDTSESPDDSSPTTFVSDGAPGDSDDSEPSSLVSSGTFNSLVTSTAVKPFTTLTIDIWDHGSAQGSDPEQTSSGSEPSSTGDGSAQTSDHPLTDDTGDADGRAHGDATDGGAWTTDSGDNTASQPTAYGTTEDSQSPTDTASATTTQTDGDTSGDTSDDTSGDTSTWYTVVTDSDVYWTTGPSGPSQVTILFSHTLTVDGPVPTASDAYATDQAGSRSRTVVGTDGKPTVIANPSNNPDTGDGQPPQQQPACTKTITGADGRPTIIIGPLAGGSEDGDAIPSGLPSLTETSFPSAPSSLSYPAGPIEPPKSDTASSGGTYTTFTSFGPDGLPTVIESALPFPRPAPATQSGPQPTQPPSAGQRGSSGPGSASTVLPYGPQDGLGVTTSFTFTYFGANGPTAVESTVVIFPTPDFSEASNALPTFFSNAPGATDGVPVPAPAITTCFSYTVIGADGLPTVVDSTVVLLVTDGGANGNPIPFIPGASQDLPAPGGAPVTTAFSHTFIGTDGYPTVLATTLVITPPGGFPAPTLTDGPSNGFPTGLPPQIPGAGGDGRALPVTTCTTFTYLGPDGLPTVTDYTYTTAGPVTAATILPADVTPPIGFPGSPTPGVPGLPGLPGNGAITTSTTLTYIGPDGKPTVTDYTYVTTGPVTAATALPGEITPPIGFSGSPTLGTPGLPANTAITTCTTFTYIGADGKPTVTDYTWTAAAPITAVTSLPGDGNPFSAPGVPTPGVPGDAGDDGVTTCATYTVIGADGRPTITEASWIIPGPLATQSPLPWPQIPADASNGLPRGIPSQITGLPGLPQTPGSGNDGAVTTICTSYTVLGADGNPTVVETTWTVPLVDSFPTPTSLGFPSAVTAITNLPQGILTGNAVTTSYTAFSVGPDGIFTPVVQTIVYTPDPLSATGGAPLPTGAIDQSSAAGVPALSQYGQGSANGDAGLPDFPPGFTPIITDGRQLPVSGTLPPFITGTLTATSTATFTETSLPWPGFPGAPGSLPPSYGDADNGNSEDSGVGGLVQPYNGASDGLPSELTLWPSSVVYGASAGNSPVASGQLATRTWVNVIPEETTTYTMNYPLTTLVTLPTPLLVPGVKRAIRRQQIPEISQLWSNSTTLTPSAFTPAPSPTLSPSPSPATPSSQVPFCPKGGNVGNYTLNFDDLQSGPLYNPDGDFWFSEGFSVVPPSDKAGPFAPSSGGQLLEFSPLSPSFGGGSSDTAEIGVGPHFAVSCFKFNLYGLSLGCAAQGNEQWCEFEFSAYTYDESTGGAQSTSWSETKRVPACSEYPAGPCALTPVELEGYTNITSVLITLRVGLDLRAWWGDDLRVGWTDNSCEAGICRGDTSAAFAKRQRSGSSLRQRLVRLVATGLKSIQG